MYRGLRNQLYSAWDIAWIRVDQTHSTLLTKISLAFQGCRQAGDLQTTGPIRIKARASGSIMLGKSVRLLAGWRSNRVGMTGPVILHTWEGGKIEIGDYSGLSAVVISSRVGVKIGKHCNIGGNVRIYDHDFHVLDAIERRSPRGCEDCNRKPIVIGDDVFIGANSLILKGVMIGDRSVIGAGSVVTKDILADTIAAGNPAVVVRKAKN